MKKYFTIHRNDAGSEAYTDEYVKYLEAEIEAVRKAIPDYPWDGNKGVSVAFVVEQTIRGISGAIRDWEKEVARLKELCNENHKATQSRFG